MPRLDLTVDQVLSTTRAVRKRLDLTRPVEREVLEECVVLAQQAPSGGNSQQTHFVIVTDPDRRVALADLYRRAATAALTPDRVARYGERLTESALYLADHLHEVPALVIPCRRLAEGQRAQQPSLTGVSPLYADAHMAAWSFMLAARERGLGTCVTTFHLRYEEDAAAILGMPFTEVLQTSLIPVAYTLGTDFKPAARPPVDSVLHWDSW